MSNSAPVKKPRATRAKKAQPSKEEVMKLLQEKLNEAKQMITEIKEDEPKLAGLQLKRVPELIKEALLSLDEDLEEIQSQYDEIVNYKEGEN